MFIIPSECDAEITLLLVNFCSVASVLLSFVWCCFRPKLSYHSRAPEHQGLPSYLTDTIVTELRSGLDMDVVRKGNENVKNGTSQIGMIWSSNGYSLLNKSDQFWYFMLWKLNNVYLSSGVRFPNLASSISFNARGPTAGVLNVSELPKETITITAPTEADEKKMDGTISTEEVLPMRESFSNDALHFCHQRQWEMMSLLFT